MLTPPIYANADQEARPPLMVWWLIWGAILFGLVVIYVALGRGPAKALPPDQHPLLGLLGMVPLFISIVIRWLMMPHTGNYARAFILFVVGVVLAEGCGLLGIFLGGLYKRDIFLLGVLGVVQFVPFYAKGYLRPKPTGFYPNN